MRLVVSGSRLWRTSTSVPDACSAAISRAVPPGVIVMHPSGTSPTIGNTRARPAPATRSEWMPVPDTPPSIARRSPTGCGANRPGTDALAATARASGTPLASCSARRSPVYASTALTTRLRAGQRQVWVMSTTLDGRRLTPGVRAARAAAPMRADDLGRGVGGLAKRSTARS